VSTTFLPFPGATELARRMPRCVAGLVIYGIGITFLLHAKLGGSPWDVFHGGLGKVVGRSVGTVIIVVGVLLLPLWRPLRQRLGIGTLLNAMLIGLTYNLVDPHLATPRAMAARLAFVVFGVAITAFGTGLYIGSGLGPGPRDGLMVGLHQRFGVSIRLARTSIELVVLAAGMALGGTVGVGTLAFAFGIGPLAQIAIPRLSLEPLDNRRQPALNRNS
jgi:uncharacterized membrane protein YczE